VKFSDDIEDKIPYLLWDWTHLLLINRRKIFKTKPSLLLLEKVDSQILLI
jgi:hypothetical protein